MKTNSHKRKRERSFIEEKLKAIPIRKLSKQSGFCKRKPKKIKPKNLLIAFLLTIWGSKNNTYSSWANKIGILINDTVSRQAVCKRVKETLVVFLQNVLKAIMEDTISTKIKGTIAEKLKQFKRILIEDSTCIKLNSKLEPEYPGNRNQKEKSHAILKIQTTYEVIKRRFIRFEITNFRKNDQGYSPEITQIAKPGDLIIRDLGYFVTEVFKTLQSKGAGYITRIKKDVNIYLENEEKPIDLARMLKRRGNLDIEVFIGVERLPVRLIAIPVGDEIAKVRRMKARTNRDRRYNPSKKHLFLLGWDLFITNVSKGKIDSYDVAVIYSIRWRIEIIYKCWKSYLGITNVLNDTNKTRLESFIYSMLIFIVLFQVHFYNYYLGKLSKKKPLEDIQISMMKLMQFISNNISCLLKVSYYNKDGRNRLLDKQIKYYCTYEHRTDRLNFNQLLLKLG